MLVAAIMSLALVQPIPPAGGPGRPRTVAAEPIPPVEVNPITAWKDIAGAYRAGPIAERVVVTLKPHERPERTSDLVIRLDAGAAQAEIIAPEGVKKIPARPGSLMLEVGPLRVHVDEMAITAIAPAGAPTFVRTAREGPMTPHVLRDVLPPLPLPQLSAAFGDPALVSNPLTPYTPTVIWSRAVLDPNPTPATLTLTGESGPDAKVTLIADGATGRMLRLRCEMQPGPTVIELTMTPQAPGDAASWRIDTAGRREVRTLLELVQRPAPGAKLENGDKPAEGPAVAPPKPE